MEKGGTYRSLLTASLIAINISLSSFYFGYSVIYLATIPFPTIASIYHIHEDSAFALGILNGAISLGGLIGSLLSSVLLEHLSRRYSCF